MWRAFENKTYYSYRMASNTICEMQFKQLCSLATQIYAHLPLSTRQRHGGGGESVLLIL